MESHLIPSSVLRQRHDPRNGHVEIVRLLLAASAAAEGRSAGALHIAARRGHVEVVRVKGRSIRSIGGEFEE